MNTQMSIDDEGRIGALYRHGIPGANLGDALDRIVKIAMAATHSPIAGVTVVERTRQSFLALRGMDDTPLDLAQSFCARAIAENRPLIIEDATSDPIYADLDLVTGKPGIRAYLGVPLVTSDGYPLGTACVMDTKPRAFSEADITILVNLARLAVGHLAARQPESFDFVTGAITRRRFQMEVEREFERASRYERPASLIFLDIDNFAEVNTSIGPTMADEVLKTLANRCREAMRSTDVFGRVSGEEFGMLLPETLAYEASQCAERLREIVSRLRFRSERGVLSVTASFGVAPLNQSIKSPIQWFTQADLALLSAKRSGRDCVAFAPLAEEDSSTLLDERSNAESLDVPKLH